MTASARNETSRERWVRETRESVHRALATERIPLSASALEGNLDVTDYFSGLGFVGVRSAREISAALRWLVARGYAEVVTDRDRFDPPGEAVRPDPGRHAERAGEEGRSAMSVADLHRGQERYRRRQRQEAICRVVLYQRWLAKGSRLRDIPLIPTDRDYAVARAAGRVK